MRCMAVEVKLRKWGNSLGCVIPKEVIAQKKLKENDVVLLEVITPRNLSDVFGTLKTKMSAQELKDLAREGWK